MKGIKSTTENAQPSHQRRRQNVHHHYIIIYDVCINIPPLVFQKWKNKLGLCGNVPVQRSVTALLLGQVSLMAKEKKTFEVELCTYWCSLNNNSSIINSFDYCWLISSGPRTRARAAAVWMPPGWSQTSPLGLHRSRQSPAGPIGNMCPCQTTSWKIQTHESLRRNVRRRQRKKSASVKHRRGLTCWTPSAGSSLSPAARSSRENKWSSTL